MKHFASALACLPLLTTALGAQVKPALAGQAAPAVAPISLTAALAFRSSLAGAAAVDPPQVFNKTSGFLQAVALRFLAYPDATKYEVLHSASPDGPWVVDHDTHLLVDSLHALPPSTAVYARVVAMKQGQGASWVAADSTNSILTMTGPPTADLPGTHVGSYVTVTACQVTSPASVRMVWLHTSGAAGYVVHPFITTPETPLPTIAVQDTELVQTTVAPGAYRYDVYARYDFPNWSGPGRTLVLYRAGGQFASRPVNVGGANPGC